ncbi:MAG TPA: endonuclease/exonuclease/phosphatase family protein [Thermoanaerobaculia bacterium]|nr:endonuclease/exonuclease/phosphatase family protein [Thermoanaerobaculia bacterium]
MRLVPRLPLVLLAVFALCLPAARPAAANNIAQTLPFSQDWTNIGLITTDNDWGAVPGIDGFRGDALTGGTGTDPQTLLDSDTPGVINVIANQTNPNGLATGGVAEFHIANPTAALNGSGTADAPYIKFYLNTTGCTGINVAYNLRDLDGSVDNAVQAVALHFRVGNSGNFTNVAAGFVADATTGPSLATLVTPVSATLPAAADNQAEVQVRVMTSNAVGNDEWVGVDDISITGTCGGGTTLSISNPSVTEGDAGTTTLTFLVNLSAPAGPGGVTFDVETQDDSATTADNDYVAISPPSPRSIAFGNASASVDVTVNGDTNPEPNETLFLNVTNVVGATAPNPQGQGTINNDDVALTPIHDIQGPGGSSPLSGSVTTTGIVTGRKSNGYYIQEPDASVDADPATSEGIFVFTSSAPPAAAAVGNLVQVTGTIAEFVPSADLLQPPLTELTSPTTVQLSTGNPLPAAIPLTATFPDPAGPFDQLERLEGMRVSVASFTVSGPTLGNVNEANATATSTGIFFGTVTGVPRPFREPGIQAPDPAPSGSIPPIPRFDSNPELLRVDSDGLTGAPILDVGTSAVVTGLVGPLDYTFRRYTILPDPGAPAPVAVGGPTATSASVPADGEFTVASYNVERFFDTVNDPGIGEPVLTATAFDNRLNKASLGIRNNLQTPDIVGVVEVENLNALQALADRISDDAIAASQPDPLYDAYLVEGNDVGGIDVGFLVKTAVVEGSTPRVTVNAVVQENAGELFVNPDSSTSLLNDRPSLRLDAVVNHANGATFPVTVIVNHLRSLNDVNSIAPGSSGWATDGDRVRAKRQKQAESLANLVQARQVADPGEHIILVGDFNAYEFNDGLADLMETITGTPPPDNETAVPGDGVDLVTPDLDNLFDTPPPPERYSYIFDGQTQNIDHVVVNGALTAATTARRIEHPRINADFQAVDRNDPNTPRRLSDHDPVVGFFEVPAFTVGDYFTVAPCRAVDTRVGSPLQDGVPQTFGVKGTCGIPATATTVVFNVTAVTPTGAGELSIWASDATPPAFSTLPFPAGLTRALFAIVSLSNDVDGEVTVQSSVAGNGTVHVLLDVMGYFE